MDKQVFAAIEINGGEVRLVVAESFNGRFNIIKVERVLCKEGYVNVYESEHLVVEAIKKAVNNASRCIGVQIQRVLLCVPSIGFTRFPLRVKADLEESGGRVTTIDIFHTITKATKSFTQPKKILVNTMISKYYCDGISTRKMPLNEKVDELFLDVDLLSGDRDVCFHYVKMIEASGLEILDIFFDNFALCKEANIFERTLGNKVLLIKFERETITFSLVSNGRLLTSKIIDSGLSAWFNRLSEKYEIDQQTAARLIKYNVALDKTLHKKSPVYIWSKASHTHTLSEEDIFEAILPELNETVSLIKEAAEAMMDDAGLSIEISGEGAELQGFNYYLNKLLSINVQNYIPETLGVRYGSLAAVMGCLYAYKDLAKIKGTLACSLDLLKFQQEMQINKVDEAVMEDHTITSKFKNIFEKEKRS
ncbi:MAG: hypothetical protein R3Y57_07300 [Erysipelotrichaceae bacterium]